MARTSRRAALALVVGLLLGMAVAATPAQAATLPAVIPALRQWTAAGGTDFQLTPSSRLVADAALSATASTFESDLEALLGRDVQRAVTAQPGDIVLSLDANAPAQPEAYALTVGSTLVIRARADAGVFNGTRTVLQLLHQQATLPAGTATDWPASPERGFSIDLARKFFTVPWLQRQIKDLAYLKLNLLHLHLTDNEAFRLESTTVPAAVAAEHYTKQQIADLVALAGRYHLTVVPEIDMPSHLAAVIDKYPQYAVKPATRGAIDIGNQAARDLLANIVREYLPLFPGPYWDIGADEYVSDYSAYPSLVDWAHQHYGANAPAIDTFYDFVNSMAALVKPYGRTLRMWNDQLTTAAHPEVALTPGIVVDYWTGARADLLGPDTLVANGHPVMNASWAATIDGVAHTVLYYVLGNAKPDTAILYERWNPLMFDGGRTLSQANAGGLRGAQLNVWCDSPREQTEDQVADGIRPTLRVLAQQLWGSAKPAGTYAAFQAIIDAVGGPSPLGQSMAAVRPPDGRMLVFAAGSSVSFRRQTAANSGFGPWTDLGGTDFSALAAAVGPGGLVSLFAVGPYGRVSVRTQTSPEAWGPWSDAPGGRDVRGVAAAADAQGVLHLFALGGDRQLYTSVRGPNGSWSAWDSSLGGSQLRSIAAASSPSGELRVFAVGGDGILYQRVLSGGSWTGWDGSLAGTDLRATTASTGAGIDVYALGGDTAAYGRFGGTNGVFQPWASYGGSDLEQLAASRNADGRPELFTLGADGVYYTKFQQTGGSWTDWLASW
ncbi:family 20 glycosylhydrolase [Fodinicola acaciae]|uniref:family 20 glycosylhydrolase n=1 Tax=Fodinicola acaciae TaxID=2681555 RepID=UPI001C9E9149|nr:family 20 glycosylhydrolase [Fodinicola acaciae]